MRDKQAQQPVLVQNRLVGRAWEGHVGQGVGSGQCPGVPGQPDVEIVSTLLIWDEGRDCRGQRVTLRPVGVRQGSCLFSSGSPHC